MQTLCPVLLAIDFNHHSVLSKSVVRAFLETLLPMRCFSSMRV